MPKLLVSTVLLTFGASAPARADVNGLPCEPEGGGPASEIGGERREYALSVDPN